MAGRIKAMRHLLHSKLRAQGTPGNWDHIINQNGMFSYTGLNGEKSFLMFSENQLMTWREFSVFTFKLFFRCARAQFDIIRMMMKFLKSVHIRNSKTFSFRSSGSCRFIRNAYLNQKLQVPTFDCCVTICFS